EIYNTYKERKVFALYGDLGAGKTAITRGFVRAAGCTDMVSSPTYTIVNEYRGPRKVAHFDMYRILDSDSLYEIGWEDYLDSGALCVVEWSENIEDALPDDTLTITIEKISDTDRRITVKP
ncbi:MAG: tRNA (adenosine(37)-N6)-threonylcarbamoyltransferase complex ATPase subunit type 1 TsaE, partial [Clostridia bacterium]|nr:tRNA (adenosine(37)-N6)-threonylcarbamoyltransferase complex ATPase subunit type 1 TsaE [Clostridia bacterium]